MGPVSRRRQYEGRLGDGGEYHDCARLQLWSLLPQILAPIQTTMDESVRRHCPRSIEDHAGLPTVAAQATGRPSSAQRPLQRLRHMVTRMYPLNQPLQSNALTPPRLSASSTTTTSTPTTSAPKPWPSHPTSPGPH
jgi:hypothetical protein